MPKKVKSRTGDDATSRLLPDNDRNVPESLGTQPRYVNGEEINDVSLSNLRSLPGKTSHGYEPVNVAAGAGGLDSDQDTQSSHIFLRDQSSSSPSVPQTPRTQGRSFYRDDSHLPSSSSQYHAQSLYVDSDSANAPNNLDGNGAINNDNTFTSEQSHAALNFASGMDDETESWSAATWSERFRYVSYYLPILTWLPKYQPRKQLLPDIIAGLSVGTMLTAQSIAYSGILKIPPSVALVTAVYSGLVYFVMGHSAILSIGPEATTSILLADSIFHLPKIQEAMAGGDEAVLTELVLSALTAISFLAGIVTLILGFLRLGYVDSVFSRPILAAFITAIGGTLIIDQTPKMFGIAACVTCDSTWEKLHHIFTELVLEVNVNWRTMCFSLPVAAYLITIRQLKTKYKNNTFLTFFPHIFLLIILTTIISWTLDVGQYGVALVGNASSGWPSPRFPQFGDDLPKYLSTAIILSILGFIETSLVNKTFFLEGSVISPNRELIALGTTHVLCSLGCAFTPFGSFTRTPVGKNAGSTSQFTGLVAVSLTCLSIIFLMPFYGHLPHGVTAGLLFSVAIGLLETHEAVFTFRTKQWMDFGLYVLMVFITFFFGVDIGLFFAFAVCLLLVIKQQNKPSVRLLGRVRSPNQDVYPVQHIDGAALDTSNTNVRPNDEFYEMDQDQTLHNAVEGLLIYQIDGPLFFCNSEGLKERTRRIERFGSVQGHPSEAPRPLELHAIIFDFTAVTMIDSTAAQVLLELIDDYHARNVRVYFVKVRKTLLALLVNSGIMDKLHLHGGVKITINSAVEDIEAYESSNNNKQQHNIPINSH